MNQLKGKRIFIIEDNRTNVDVLMTALKYSGAAILTDTWNLETLDIIRNNLPIDLILLDLLLRRGMSGYDLFEALQQDTELKHIPVIAISSLDAETQIPKAQALGMAGFISQPINTLKLASQISSVLSGEKIWITSR